MSEDEYWLLSEMRKQRDLKHLYMSITVGLVTFITLFLWFALIGDSGIVACP